MKVIQFILFIIIFHSVCNGIAQETFLPGNTCSFIENKGQWNSDASFLFKNKSSNSWVLSSGAILFDFFRTDKKVNNSIPSDLKEVDTTSKILGHRFKLDWLNSSPPAFNPEGLNEGYLNYFLGMDTTKYARNVKSYNVLTGKGLYDGIDVKYYSQNGNLRYDLVVHPNIDPNVITLKIQGVDKLSIANNMTVELKTSIGVIKLQDLYVYELETKRHISCKWILNDHSELKLSLGEYDHSKTLIIDPMIFSTYLGGTVNDISRGIRVDKYGNSYIAGEAMLNFDVTLGAYQTTFHGGLCDAFVSKINSSGTALIFSTYIGGNSDDAAQAIDIDTLGNIYIAGKTNSLNYPTTSGVLQSSFMGFTMNGFITKLNAAGNGVIYSTYLGGSSNNTIYGIAIDNFKNAYVTGITTSSNFPTTAGCFQNALSGYQDAFVSKLNQNGSSLLYSTYLGGLNDDFAFAIDVDKYQNAYITGYTLSTDYDITPGALQNFHAGGVYDCFVTKINSTGNALVYSTYVGGLSADYARCIIVDDRSNAYIGGSTGNGGFPVTIQYGSGGGYVTKFDSLGTSVIFSVSIGGMGFNEVLAIDIDKFYNIFIAGITTTTDFPLSVNAYQSTLSSLGSYDIFISKISPPGTNLYYSSYFGGGNEDIPHGIAVDLNGDIYFTGETKSLDYDLTPSPIQNVNQGTRNVFVTKLNICPTILSNINTVSPTCYNVNDGYIYASPSGGVSPYSYSWNNGNSNDTLFSPISGNYSLVVTDSYGCSIIDSISIPVQTPLTVSVSAPPIFCSGLNSTFNANTSNSSASFQWQINSVNVGTNSPTYSYLPSNGDTVVCIAYLSSTCQAISNQIIISTTPTLVPTIIINASTTDSICSGTNVLFTANITNGGTSPIYQWQINGVNVGSNNNTFSTSTLNDGDTVSCIITSNYPCLSANNITSNLIFFTVLPNLTSTVLISSMATTICSGDSLIFTATPTNGGSSPSYQWQVNGSNTGSNNAVFATNNLSNGDIVSVIMTSNASCLNNINSNSNSITVTVDPCLPPVSSYTSSSNQICVDGCINYINTSSNNPTSWLWIFSGGNPSSSTNQNPTICYNTVGIYDVTLISVNQYGADTIVLTSSINVLNSIPVTISGDDQITICEKSTLSADPNNGSYSWGPNEFISCLNCQSVQVNPHHTQQYWVTYTSPEGCIAKDTILINVDDTKTYFMPTGLSPNNDGVNDSANFHGVGVEKFNLKIFDRVGEKVFESTQMEVGWDGSYNGVPMNNGVFVYLLEIYFCDGEYKSEQGNISIVK